MEVTDWGGFKGELDGRRWLDGDRESAGDGELDNGQGNDGMEWNFVFPRHGRFREDLLKDGMMNPWRWKRSDGDAEFELQSSDFVS